MYQFKLPDIGEGVHEAELASIAVTIGQSVLENDVLCVVITDKATVDITSPVSGVISKIYYAVHDMMIVGSPLFDIDLSEPNNSFTLYALLV